MVFLLICAEIDSTGLLFFFLVRQTTLVKRHCSGCPPPRKIARSWRRRVKVVGHSKSANLSQTTEGHPRRPRPTEIQRFPFTCSPGPKTRNVGSVRLYRMCKVADAGAFLTEVMDLKKNPYYYFWSGEGERAGAPAVNNKHCLQSQSIKSALCGVNNCLYVLHEQQPTVQNEAETRYKTRA